MYTELILASPFTRILNPSTTVRCEHIAREGGFHGQAHPHYLDVVSSIQVMEWIGVRLHPFSCQAFGMSLPKNIEREGGKSFSDLRATMVHFPEFSQDLEKHRSCWRLHFRYRSNDNSASLAYCTGQRLQVDRQLTESTKRLSIRLPMRGPRPRQRFDFPLYFPEAYRSSIGGLNDTHEGFRQRFNGVASANRDKKGEEERENGEEATEYLPGHRKPKSKRGIHDGRKRSRSWHGLKKQSARRQSWDKKKRRLSEKTDETF